MLIRIATFGDIRKGKCMASFFTSLFSKYNQGYEIKEDETCGKCSKHGENVNAKKTFMGKLEERDHFEDVGIDVE